MSRTNSFVLLILLSMIMTIKYLYGQDNEISIYGGLHYAPLITADFKNFDISDWENYGLKSQNIENSEGRVRVPLGNYQVSGMKLGLLLGGYFPLSEMSSVLAEFQYFVPKDIDILGFSLGNNYNFFKLEGFDLGFTIKAGYFFANIDFGEIHPVINYSNTVCTTRGTFTEGDSLSIDIHGFIIQLGITPSFTITEQIGIQAQIGYGLSLAFKPEITIQPINDGNKIKLDMDDRAIVCCDGSNSQAGLEPSVKSQGLYFHVGVFYYFDI